MRSLPARGTWVSWHNLKWDNQCSKKELQCIPASRRSSSEKKSRINPTFLSFGICTYDKFSLSSQISIANFDKGVIVFTLAQGRAVNISCEEADGWQNTRVKCGLRLELKKGTGIRYDSDLTRNACVGHTSISEPNMNRKGMAHQVTSKAHPGCLTRKCYLDASRKQEMNCTCYSAIAIFQWNEKVDSQSGILQ